MDEATDVFADRYLNRDGSIRWNPAHAGQVRTDAFYEGIQNWPLFYLMGGGDRVIQHAQRSWEAITRQLTAYGLVRNEYPRDLDWFHLAEGNLPFYGLCVASDLSDQRWTDRAVRFADLYLNDPIYDSDLKIIRGSMTGSDGLASFMPDGVCSWAANMAPYGLPIHGLAGITEFDDLKVPTLAGLMGRAMRHQMSRGDCVENLAATTLPTIAYLRTGDDRYRRWVLDYTEAWIDRAKLNGGLLPDNVGLSGKIGEYTNGQWYGGHYGWTWPHGFYNVAMGALIAASNSYLLSGDSGFLELPRAQLDKVYALGGIRNLRDSNPSLPYEQVWKAEFGFIPSAEMFLVPWRYNQNGWFDYQPPLIAYPTSLWALSRDPRDWERLERLRDVSGYDWRRNEVFRNKEENGHDAPWLRFLANDNPSYPEQALAATLAQTRHRVALMRADEHDLDHDSLDKHYLTGFNPVFTEVLLQLTTGSPQVLYNSGLPHTSVRYWDRERDRPGLPRDVAALVTTISGSDQTLELVNLDSKRPHTIEIGIGIAAEHEIDGISYDAPVDAAVYPGHTGYNGGVIPAVATKARSQGVGDVRFVVQLRPGTRLVAHIRTRRFVHLPKLRSEH
jgi:hypothetical protein